MSFQVSQSKIDGLAQKMEKLGICDADIQETFVRSGGPGGQHVNKVSTCVILTHPPTGIIVKCQETRSQAMNRYFARVLLVKKIESRILGEKSAEAQRIFKLKKQKRKRSKRAKEKILAGKHYHSQKKQLRSRNFDD